MFQDFHLGIYLRSSCASSIYVEDSQQIQPNVVLIFLIYKNCYITLCSTLAPRENFAGIVGTCKNQIQFKLALI